MSIIPLKQTVTVKREVSVDKFGKKITSTFDLKCRFVEEDVNELTTSGSNGYKSVASEETLYTGTFTFDKFTDILSTDIFVYVDESKREKVYKVGKIKRIRGLNGKAILTKVSVVDGD